MPPMVIYWHRSRQIRRILSSFEDNCERHPNAEAIFGKELPKQWMYLDNSALNIPTDMCKVPSGHYFKGEYLCAVYKFGRLAGIKEWKYAMFDDYKMILSAKYGEDHIYILVMVNLLRDVPEPHIVTPHCEALRNGNKVDWNAGKEYYDELMEQRRKEEEEYAKANFKVFEVGIVMHANMAVRARTWEEAKEIAEEWADEDMFDDSDIVAESYSETCRDGACDCFDHYYDENGEQDWEEED